MILLLRCMSPVMDGRGKPDDGLALPECPQLIQRGQKLLTALTWQIDARLSGRPLHQYYAAITHVDSAPPRSMEFEEAMT